jgi:hypothetical protein
MAVMRKCSYSSRIRGCQSGGYKEFCPLRHNAVQSVESQLTFSEEHMAFILRVEE